MVEAQHTHVPSTALWGAWYDRRLTDSELRALPFSSPALTADMHACVLRVGTQEQLEGAYKHPHRPGPGCIEVGALEEEVWEAERCIYDAARAGEYGTFEAGAGIALRHRVCSAVHAALLEQAGWCRWCRASSFVALALGVDESEVTL